MNTITNVMKSIPKLLLLSLLMIGCQSPTTGTSSTKGLTINWSKSASRTILPASYPTAVTYDIVLTPASGAAVSKTGLTDTSVSFSGLTPAVYSVTVNGKDSAGEVITSGSTTADTTASASTSVAVTLSYIISGKGTGGVNLTFNLSSAGAGTTSAVLTLVDPAGNVFSPRLTTSGSNYIYTNASVLVGNYQAYIEVTDTTNSKMAMKNESFLVAQNVTTSGTVSFASSDFGASSTYVPVTGVSVSASTLSLATGAKGTLSATIAPATASNQLVQWSSSNTSVATVSAGVVTAVAAGSATITATTVDGSKTATSAVTVSDISITFDANGGTGTMAAQTLASGATASLTANAFTRSGFYTFSGWATASSGTVAYVDKASYTMGSTSVTLYAVWTSGGGVVTTLAGNPEGSGSDDGTGTKATFYMPGAVATDGTNVYVADSGNSMIRKIVISTGVVTTLAGSGSDAIFNNPQGVATDGTNVYVADTQNNRIRKIGINTGVLTTLAGSGSQGSTNGTGTAAQFSSPGGVATDGTNLYVADTGNSLIRQIVISTGVVTTLAGSGGAAGWDGTGTAASFNRPHGVATDGTNVYVADTGNSRIRKIVISTGVVTTLAGTTSLGSANGTGTAASFNYPYGVATDGTNVYVADSENNLIRKIVISTGVVTTLAGSGSEGSTNGTGTAASFGYPNGVATDGTNVYVADTFSNLIRKIQPSN